MSRPMNDMLFAIGEGAFRGCASGGSPGSGAGPRPGGNAHGTYRPGAIREPGRGGSQGREEQPDLASGRLGRVRAVDDVVLDLEGEVAADRAGRGRDGVRGAGQLAEPLDGAGALGDQRD